VDDNLIVVLTAVPLADHAEAQQWFQTLRDTFDQQPDTWDAYVAALVERAPGRAEDFATYVGSALPDPLDNIRDLLDYGDTLPDWYFATTQQGDPAPYDESEWQAFLAENGPMWAGTEETWPGWREWFAYTAAERGLGEPATGFLTWLDAQPDKVAAFATYGVVIAAPDDAAEILSRLSSSLAEFERELNELAVEEVGDASSFRK
jgi:hypothetical protein